MFRLMKKGLRKKEPLGTPASSSPPAVFAPMAEVCWEICAIRATCGSWINSQREMAPNDQILPEKNGRRGKLGQDRL
jgi:hypothetical protein